MHESSGSNEIAMVVLAARVKADGTSGGLRTHKYARLLSSLHEVVVAAGDTNVSAPLSDLAAADVKPGGGHGIRVVPVGLDDSISGRREGWGRWLWGKAQALSSYGSGFPPEEWFKVRAWRRVLRGLLGSDRRPQAIFAFGAGMDFTPHMALTSGAGGQPWVGYYHDPWPGHLYPPPYRWKWSIPGWNQERWHRRILRRAPALAFPSARLRDWILCGDLEALRNKAFVLPHLAVGPEVETLQSGRRLPAQFARGQFHVVHAGTMLRHRSPWALLEGFRRFAAKEAERSQAAKLWLIGRVDRHIAADPRWKELTASPGVVVVQDRVPYEDSMEILWHATAGIVLEAEAAESPFYPGKLADLLYLRKPVLAVTPMKSTVRDMLGANYPLLCAPAQPEEVEARLELLWNAWRQQRLSHLEPPEAAVEMASPARAKLEIERILEHFARAFSQEGHIG